MPVQVLVTDTVRSQKTGKVKALLRASLKTLGRDDCEVSVLITNDEGIRELNKKYRSKDRATDVLSFPMDDDRMLGDIVISRDRVVAQARDYGAGPDEELSRLCVHGLLHLLGYDHVNGGRQAARMKKREGELLEALRRAGTF